MEKGRGMKMTKLNFDNQKQLAIEEMTLFGIAPTAIRQFTDVGTILKSVAGELKPLSALEAELVTSFEKQAGCLAYHAIYSCVLACDLLSVLFVPSSQEECESGLKIIENGRAKKSWQLPVYCINLSRPFYSGYVFAKVLKLGDGLIRIRNETQPRPPPSIEKGAARRP